MLTVPFYILYLFCGVSGALSALKTSSNSPIQNEYEHITLDLGNAGPGIVKTTLKNLSHIENVITLININPDVGFIVVQAHALMENLTLSYTSPVKELMHVTGTNIGLVYTMEPKIISHLFLFRQGGPIHNLSETLTVLLAATIYSKDDPVPGGCNLSFETEIAPYQKVFETDHLVTLLSQPPSMRGENCNLSNVTTEMYYLYLTEYQKDESEYFKGVQKMLSPEDIMNYGTKVPGLNKYKQSYGKYTGTGRIFAVVAKYGNRSSSYVPARSYGCKVQNWDDECLEIVGEHWRVVTAFMFICGLFVCTAGHRFFQTSLFIIGYSFGVLTMLILVNLDNDFSEEGKAIYTLIMGLFFGCAWNFVWWKYGIPMISVQLSFILSGFLFWSVLYFTPLGDMFLFELDTAFWTFFAIVLLFFQIPVLCLKPLTHIVILSFLGSHAFIVAMSYYMGGILPYILINMYRRLILKNFGLAVIDPPSQFRDISLIVLWAAVFCMGVYVQRKQSLGKPPFPPRRTTVEITVQGERTPLLYH